MIVLSIASIFVGYLTRDIYLGFGAPFNGIFIHPDNLSIIDTELSIDTTLKVLPLVFTLLGTLSILVLYEFQYSLIKVYNCDLVRGIYRHLNNKFMFDQIINNVVLRSNLALGYKLNQFVDKGALQVAGPRGIYDSLNLVVYNFIRLSTGSLLHFSVYLLTGILAAILSSLLSLPVALIFLFLIVLLV